MTVRKDIRTAFSVFLKSLKTSRLPSDKAPHSASAVCTWVRPSDTNLGTLALQKDKRSLIVSKDSLLWLLHKTGGINIRCQLIIPLAPLFSIDKKNHEQKGTNEKARRMFEFLMNPVPGRSSGRPQLPLDIVSSIISRIESPGDLARVSRSSRIHHFLTVPLLYRNVVLVSRREGRRSYIALAQMGALLKPGIAACVQRLEVINEMPSGQDRRGEEHGVWAVAVVGIISGMSMLEEFLWNSESMMHPILYEALSRHPKLTRLRIIHPLSLHPPPPPPFAPPIVFRNLKSIHLTGLGSRTTYNWSMSSMPALQVFKVSWRISTRLSVIFPEHVPVRIPRIFKELHISNVVLDIPIRQCLDLLELQKLSLLDCSVGEESSWDEILCAEEQKVTKAGSPASVLSAGSGGVTRQSPIPRMRQLKLKSLRINEVGRHWVNFLSSFVGLEELYILPSTSVIEEDTVEPFLDAIIKFHGSTMRNLRLSTSQPVERRCASKLVRSCKGLEEISLRIPKSEWKFIEILILFLTHIRVFHLLTTELSSHAEEYEELLAHREETERQVAQEGESLLEFFGFGTKWAWVIDRTPSWVDGVDPETGKVEKRRVKRGHIERISVLSEKVGVWKAEERI